MTSRSKVIGTICLLGSLLILFKIPTCSRWFAERAIRRTLARQADVMQQGGSISVSSAQLDSLWNDSIRYLAIIPESISTESVSAFGTALAQSLPDSRQVLGICMENNHLADSLLTSRNIRSLHQTGFGLTALRPNRKIGLYAIRRTGAAHIRQPISYVLSLHDEL